MPVLGWFNWYIFSFIEFQMYEALMLKINYAEKELKLFVNSLYQLGHLFIFLFKHLGL